MALPAELSLPVAEDRATTCAEPTSLPEEVTTPILPPPLIVSSTTWAAVSTRLWPLDASALSATITPDPEKFWCRFVMSVPS